LALSLTPCIVTKIPLPTSLLCLAHVSGWWPSTLDILVRLKIAFWQPCDGHPMTWHFGR
jgi:hypothetical protein